MGSARIGQSLKPNQAGKPFDINSDLDLFVVSETLFELMVSDFNIWNSSFLSGMVIPRNNNERIFWSDNSARIPKNIQRGFIN
ncbi:hypothetical protein CUN60_06210 [Aquella oligotrophica]|uniref:Uncharacterized protein n=1 Tax=Aquella oligotrophica TaxID=2067065 RepID=A0A2I7N617_9NEIS|nr:hypothetical protein CUN60_06210 [Aquella oligotrophica]